MKIIKHMKIQIKNEMQTFYRKVVPIGLRYYIAKKKIYKLEKLEFDRLLSKSELETKYLKEINYMKKYKEIKTIPYKFIEKYKESDIEVFYDKSCKHPYVVRNGKRMYFPSHYSKKFIKAYYNSIRVEQDYESPHCYFEKEKSFCPRITFIDIGAAEGVISLDVIDDVDFVILCECNKEWLRALELTFSPWSEKTRIVSKFVGDEDTEKSVKLDTLILNKKDDNNFIVKMDVEGNEEIVLKGAEITIKELKNVEIYMCTYHYNNDADKYADYFIKKNFRVTFSKGYMYYGAFDSYSFRKGIIRVSKNAVT